MTKAPPPPTLKSARTLPLTYEIPISKTNTFWEGLKENKIFTTRCKKCGELYFPPSSDCPNCLSADMDWVEISGEAELETFTQIVVRPATFAKYEPYIVAIGRLKEGVRALAWLTGIKREDIRVGMKIKLVGKVGPEGTPTYEFVPL